MTDAELDAMLDAVTAVDARPDLVGRVVRAIERGDVAPRRATLWPRLAIAATGAIVLVAVTVGWRAAQPLSLPGLVDAPPPVVASVTGPVAVPEADAVIVRRASERRPRSGRVEDPWPSRLPALERSAPLAIERLERDAIRESRLGVEPLSIAQLEIVSLER